MGIKVWAGITNDEESMKYFASLGVDGIMTDDINLGITFQKEVEHANR